MLKFAVVALLVAVSSASLDSQWLIFKSAYNRTYSGDENLIRRFIWEENLKKIEAHNEKYLRGESGYYLGENEYADMTEDEFTRKMNGMRVNLANVPTPNQGMFRPVLPATVDWRTKGYVTPVKNQGQCGSCWAFSTTGSLEGAHMKSTGKLVSLSESNLVDCSQKWGNQGCNGGLMDQAFQYVIDNKGIDTEESYPYKPEDRPCKFQRSTVGSTEKSFTDVDKGNEEALQKAVAEIGPISVAIDASHSSFQLYRGGVYDEPECSSTMLDHGVLAVGYGTKDGKDYWLVKNSWGTTWGEQGYIMMSRNKNNQCGIASMASYPAV